MTELEWTAIAAMALATVVLLWISGGPRDE